MRRKMAGLAALTTIMAASCGAAPPESGAPSESIAVHGDWTIDIYNEDGTLDEHIEFSNALTGQGEELLTAILSRSASTGKWGVFLDNGSLDAPCPSFCRIGEPGFGGESDNLVLTVVSDPTPTLRLTGSVVAEQTGEVGQVAALNRPCADPTVGPATCNPNSGSDPLYSFTSTSLTTPIGVEVGQIVQVQVDISFTTG